MLEQQSGTIPIDKILDNTNNAVIAVNLEGQIIYANRAVYNILQTPDRDLVGQSITTYFPGTGLLRVFEKGIPELGQQLTMNNKVLLSNRTPIHIHGELVGAVAVFQDITDLQNVIDNLVIEHEKTKQLQRTLEVVLNTAYDGLIVTNEKGIVTMTNQAFANFFNKSPEEMIGKHIQEIYENPKFTDVLVTGQPVHGYIHDLNGHEIIASRIPITQEGKIVGALGKVVFKDVNELYALTKKVNSLRSELDYYKKTILKKNFSAIELLKGKNPRMVSLVQIALRVAKSESTVLLRGESGTGKELFAQLLHMESLNKEGPFIKVNCAAVPGNLLESELFGYEEGAFTGARKGGKIGKFELADGGTLFLDEIGDMEMAMQVKLLRVLQEREIERLGSSKPRKIQVRLVAATNRDLETMIREKQFREDLYYRLNVVTLTIPPLRDRIEDIDALIDTFIKKFNLQFAQSVTGVSEETRKVFLNYRWPGNVRELENIIERAFNMLDGSEIQLKHLPSYLQILAGTETRHLSGTLESILDTVEKEALIYALDATNGNKVQAAKSLGLSRAGLYKKLIKHDLH
ncbi:transcriptional regulator containing PAS, AAA-type ATPase, and DNA-binding domains [Desulfosporosinus acidiphilus SJ4]|uniref:Transcriptional regulator containing PAS, AAA-type ATPase, and DNA-binding domains n=1 Tax=Desulfosporosinus acidiphilus (strain DSM 22704 / JCM 16185 / SJ4) TaxID=646529 RepID=I4D7R6_DESAJ|nr:sigma-54-dependent Fis family transcriptional regulator [Desulfosporosinus acidiphilus]AFM41840.1 transcriptional regulator containing PAS, AAA-type ATPase, and DNA-binding domains [Desulfosporosinus acidiphilus SJ4]